MAKKFFEAPKPRQPRHPDWSDPYYYPKHGGIGGPKYGLAESPIVDTPEEESDDEYLNSEEFQNWLTELREFTESNRTPKVEYSRPRTGGIGGPTFDVEGTRRDKEEVQLEKEKWPFDIPQVTSAVAKERLEKDSYSPAISGMYSTNTVSPEFLHYANGHVLNDPNIRNIWLRGKSPNSTLAHEAIHRYDIEGQITNSQDYDKSVRSWVDKEMKETQKNNWETSPRYAGISNYHVLTGQYEDIRSGELDPSILDDTLFNAVAALFRVSPDDKYGETLPKVFPTGRLTQDYPVDNSFLGRLMRGK